MNIPEPTPNVPLADQPRTTVDTEIEVPHEIYELAEKRAAAADGDLDEYLLDHLMIEYEFVKSTE